MYFKNSKILIFLHFNISAIGIQFHSVSHNCDWQHLLKNSFFSYWYIKYWTSYHPWCLTLREIMVNTRVPAFTTLIQHSTGSPSHSEQTRRNKRHPNWKGGSKGSLFTGNMIVYIENPIGSPKNYLT